MEEVGQWVCKPSSNFPSTTPLQGLSVICETCLFRVQAKFQSFFGPGVTAEIGEFLK